jgi:hypothetical protein
MTDGEDKGKGFLDSLKPTWRDALYAVLGIGVGMKAPGYLRAKAEEQARYQAKILVEEMHKQEELYKQKKAGEG